MGQTGQLFGIVGISFKEHVFEPRTRYKVDYRVTILSYMYDDIAYYLILI